ncbi:CHAD domain-containing protein [Cyanobium sp. Morenito 9A2]|uniref:CHAD domain-containing protein n=1 Tax=Cyanobium sp. Morenito 9A2 TaxID=2823718 RepID=UPI0020CF3A8C|nr:CHAD domain-containing protein [Cyanobium sp. Morenito 9A2]MCP9848523.1 CHAD domain-containing protein [Cyanobium sp. Morenito 9A2]
MSRSSSPELASSGRQRSAGSYAAGRLALALQRIVALHPDVLADQDPEPLHQLRVAMRRLRTVLMQFERALVLPEAVSDERIARVARRLGVARDLDVLRDQLDNVYLPQLSASERELLKPIRKRLRRDRRLAFDDMEYQLKRGRYLALLAALQGWLRQPRLTPLGQEPVHDWLVEWSGPCLSGLMTHPGWWAADLHQDATVLHDLRKRVKGARYGLDNLAPLLAGAPTGWVERLKSVQSCLGDLQDVQVLRAALAQQLDHPLAELVPGLANELQRREGLSWGRWRLLAQEALDPSERGNLNRILSRG